MNSTCSFLPEMLWIFHKKLASMSRGADKCGQIDLAEPRCDFMIGGHKHLDRLLFRFSLLCSFEFLLCAFRRLTTIFVFRMLIALAFVESGLSPAKSYLHPVPRDCIAEVIAEFAVLIRDDIVDGHLECPRRRRDYAYKR